MFELRVGFDSYKAYEAWKSKNAAQVPHIVNSMIAEISANGITEPISNRYFPTVQIDRSRLHLSVDAGVLNSRKRVGLLAVQTAISCLPVAARRNARILGAEAVTYVASVLRGAYAHYLGTEYLPTREEQAHQFPIPHLDLMDVRLPADSFDVFFSAHVLEHVPSVDKAIHQVARILRPGGILVSTYPFRVDRVKTETKAKIDERGELVHLTEPEYHRNPVRQEEDSLVFQLPGWDVLEMCKSAGLSHAKLVLMASTRYGVISDGTIGMFALFARKPISGEAQAGYPPEISYQGPYI
jgi:SAM-dependent methyltransferase